jgi:hypothetical protein
LCCLFFFFLAFIFAANFVQNQTLVRLWTSSELDKSWFLKKQEKVNTIQPPSCIFLTFIPIFACLVCFPSIPKNGIEHFYFKCFENKTILELEIQLQQDKDQFSMNELNNSLNIDLARRLNSSQFNNFHLFPRLNESFSNEPLQKPFSNPLNIGYLLQWHLSHQKNSSISFEEKTLVYSWNSQTIFNN